MKDKIIRAAASVLAVILLAVVLILFCNANPMTAFQYFVFGLFGTLNGFTEIFVKATPLILMGLGVSISFRTGFFNIGAEGQFYMGALMATFVAIKMPGPAWMRCILAILVAFIAGGVWAFIPAILKSKWGISETVNTIMFNYIATMFVGIAIRRVLMDSADYLPQSAKTDCNLPLLLPPTRLHLGFFIAVAIAVLIWFIMNKTTLGYELKISGSNPRGAYCVGIPVQRSLLAAAILSGGLSGIAGSVELLGVQHRLMENLSAGNGFTAILIALLAKNHPLGVILVSILYAALQVGANTMQRQMGIPSSIVSILIGFIVFLILAKDFWRLYKQARRDRAEVKKHG